ncbi:DUF1684 domain-containing protein [Neolewinella sp.]|uniref:DUF1684 domain-containing protein n=1 Tax=Neolewinella sp. TaxID=2993543 RepID=UPI003B525B19
MLRTACLLISWIVLLSCAGRPRPTATPRPTAIQEAANFQAELSATYLDPKRTILDSTKLAKLQELGGLPFFPLDPAYRVVAAFTPYADPEIVRLPTSSQRMAEFRVYGRASFTLGGQVLALDVLETTNPNVPEEYAGLLFLPFQDATSGSETYGGGRYLDLPKPEGDKLMIDFNKAYQPYCAYSDGFSCPVPPAQNRLPVAVRAGVRLD